MKKTKITQKEAKAHEVRIDELEKIIDEDLDTYDKVKKLEPIFTWLDSKDYNNLDDYHKGIKDILNVLIGDEDIDSLIQYFNLTNE